MLVIRCCLSLSFACWSLGVVLNAHRLREWEEGAVGSNVEMNRCAVELFVDAKPRKDQGQLSYRLAGSAEAYS